MLSTLPGFVLAAILIALVPGPATALIIRQTLRSGTRAAAWTAIGDTAGVLFWGVAASIGLVTLLAANRTAYDVLRFGGAVILAAYGLRTIIEARKTGELIIGTDPSRSSNATAVRAGLLSNLANPKAAVFAFSFYPQFLPTHGSVVFDAVILALIQGAIETVWYLLLAQLVDHIGIRLSSAKVRRRMERTMGGVLIALGIRAALEHR